MTKTRRRTGDPAVYEGMQVVIDHGLRQDGSALTPGVAVWTAENFATLRRHFIEQPDLGKDTYLQKLERQLVEQPTGRSSSWRSCTMSTCSYR